MAHSRKNSEAISYPEGKGGREVCLKNAAGRREYKRRLQCMWERQEGLCCLCGLPLRLDESTFEHQRPKGMGGAFADDRIEIQGKPVNGAAHWLCNGAKGSRRVEYLIQPHTDLGQDLEQMLEGD
jgi:hypothetical protein